MTKKNSKDKAPSIQFYPNDWLTDVKLRMCEVDTRGLWMDLLCYMHNNEKYGYLVINGNPLDEKQIRKLTKISPKKFKKMWDELTNFGIIRQDENGAFYSKRLVEDGELRAMRREAGKKGGNPKLTPNLVNQKDNQKDNQEVKQEVNQSDKQNPTPSARYTSSSSSSSISTSDNNIKSSSKESDSANSKNSLPKEEKKQADVSDDKTTHKHSKHKGEKEKNCAKKEKANTSPQSDDNEISSTEPQKKRENPSDGLKIPYDSEKAMKERPNNLVYNCLLAYCEEFEERFGVYPEVFNRKRVPLGKPSQNMKLIISKLQNQYRKNNGLPANSEVDSTIVFRSFKLLLKSIDKKDWLGKVDNFDVSLINSKFDNVFAKIKMKINGGSNDEFEEKLSGSGL